MLTQRKMNLRAVGILAIIVTTSNCFEYANDMQSSCGIDISFFSTIKSSCIPCPEGC